MGAHFKFLNFGFLKSAPVPKSIGLVEYRLEKLTPAVGVLGSGVVMAIGLSSASAALANPVIVAQVRSFEPIGVKQSQKEPISADAFPVPSSLQGNPAPTSTRAHSTPAKPANLAPQATPMQPITPSVSNPAHQGFATADDFPVPTAIAGESPDNSRQPTLWSTRSVSRRPRAQANPLGTKPPSVPVASAVRRGAIRPVMVSAEAQLASQRLTSPVTVRVGNFPQSTPTLPVVTQPLVTTTAPQPNPTPAETVPERSRPVVTQTPPKVPAQTVAAQNQPQRQPFRPITQTPPAASNSLAARAPLYGSSLTPPPIDITPRQADLLRVPNGNAPIGYAGNQRRVFRLDSVNQPRYRVLVLTPNEAQQAQLRTISPDAFPTQASGQSAMQAGSFSDIALARELETSLRQSGMRTVIEPIR